MVSQLSALLKGVTNSQVDFVYAASKPKMIHTYSPLDGLLGGGIAEGSTTVVMGETGEGKTALLQFIYSQIHKLPNETSIYVGNDINHRAGSPTFAYCSEFDDLIALVQTIREQTTHYHPVLCIDDATMYPARPNKDGSRALGGNAQAWAVLMRHWKDDTVVLASQTHRHTGSKNQPAAGRGVSFAADTMLSVHVSARIKNGLVLEVETVKNRRGPVGEKCLLSVVRDVGGRWVEE